MSKRTKIIIGIAVIVLVSVGIGLKKSGKIGSSGRGLEVELGEAKKVTIIETVTASGKIQPEIEIKLSPEVSGEIIELNVKEGDKVKGGDVLVKINPDLYETSVTRAKAAVKSAEAAVSQSEAQFNEAEKSYNRNKSLKDQDVISQAEFDASQRMYNVALHQLEASESQLESARATLKEARQNLKRTTIVAPQDGSISVLNVELGERVVGTAQMAGTELLRVANLENMEVLVEVNENDIVRVSLGDTANVEVDAYLDRMFKGVVTEIANSANLLGVSADQVTTFEVKVRILPESYEDMDLNGKESPFRPGMTATVDILTEVADGILSVPIAAVSTRTDTAATSRFSKKKKEDGEEATNTSEEEEEYEVVFVTNGKRAKLKVVTTGIQDDKNIEIKSGLEEGEEIIVGPYSAVSKKLMNDSEIQLKEETSKGTEEKEE
ncbi:MAG: efflux RND transporter periplasmic adaptor subunit [Schleiferiaceae bacterium]|nr:efflux RND transporter periplasmic adaptor subunit [Schleiferiaceae bacterium]